MAPPAVLVAMVVVAVPLLELAVVDALAADNVDDRNFGVHGEPGVNVLVLNIALDEIGPVGAGTLAD